MPFHNSGTIKTNALHVSGEVVNYERGVFDISDKFIFTGDDIQNKGSIDCHTFIAPELKSFVGLGHFHAHNLAVTEEMVKLFPNSCYENLLIIPQHSEAWSQSDYDAFITANSL